MNFTKYAANYTRILKSEVFESRNITLTEQQLTCSTQSRLFDIDISYSKKGLSTKRVAGNFEPLRTVFIEFGYQRNASSNTTNLPLLEDIPFIEDLGNWTQTIGSSLPMMELEAIYSAMWKWVYVNVSRTCSVSSDDSCWSRDHLTGEYVFTEFGCNYFPCSSGMFVN